MKETTLSMFYILLFLLGLLALFNLLQIPIELGSPAHSGIGSFQYSVVLLISMLSILFFLIIKSIWIADKEINTKEAIKNGM